MPIDLSWYIPSRVIRIYVYGVVTPQQLHIFPTKGHSMFHSGITPIHILLDDDDAQPPIPSISQLHQGLQLRSDDIDLFGWVVAVGETNLLATIILPLLMRLLGIHYIRVKTMQDAMEFLIKQDPTLEAYSPPEEKIS